MTIKPVLVPDHNAADLRKLMDHFATAAEPASPAAQANRIRQQLQESRPDVEEGINEDLSPEIKKLNKAYRKLFSIIAYDKNDKRIMSKPKAHKEVSRQLGVDPDDMDEYLRLEYYDFFDTVNKEWDKQKDDGKKYYSNEIYGKVDADPTKIKEARPDVMRHAGDKTIRVVKRGGKPIGEIGTDSEASEGNGPYYVKLYDGSYDAVGYDTAEEALAELKAAIKQGVTEGSAGWMLRQDPALAKKVRDNTQGYKDLKKMAGKPVPNKDEKGVAEGRVDQMAPSGADYSKHSTDELKALLRPGVMGRNELRFKTLIRQELRKREQQGVAEHSMYGDEEVSWEKGGRRAPTGAFRNPAVVKTDKSIGTRVSDIGPGGKEYNVKTDKEWDKQKGVAEGRAGADDTDTVGFSVNSEAAYNAVMKRFGNAIDHDETSGVMYAPARIWPQIEMTAFDADPESGAVRVEDDVMEQGVAEAKSLARRVRVVKTGETGTIRQIKHGAYKGAPKTYYVDLDNGGQADNLPASALRLIKGEVAEVKSKTHPEHSAMDTPAVQGAIAGMKQRHEKEPFDLEKARALGQKLAARNRDPRRK